MVDLNRLRNLAQALQQRGQQAQTQQRVHGRSWYRFENSTDTSTTEIYLYDFIGEWGVTAQDFVNDLRSVRSSVLSLHINSEGGEIFDGLAIYEALRQHPSKVVGYVDGIAASSASFIAMACDWLVMAPRARLMVHDGHGLCIGNAADMREVADLLDDLSNNIADIYADRAGGTRSQWRSVMLGPNKASDGTWYDAQAALSAGLVDEIAGAGERQDSWSFTGTWDAPSGDSGWLDMAMDVHHTDTVDEPWDGPAAVAAMPNDEATLKATHAWHDSSGDADMSAKSSYKFPHHKTKGGPANLAACRNGLARLDGANIPLADKAGVRRHLQAHLDDAQSDGGDDAVRSWNPAALLADLDDACTPNEPLAWNPAGLASILEERATQ